LREEIMSERSSHPGVRLLKVLEALGLSASSWYYRPVAPEQRQTPGPKPQSLPAEVVALVKSTSETYPWYGYQKIAVICRRTDPSITDRQSYQVMRMHDLLHKRPVRSAAVHGVLSVSLHEDVLLKGVSSAVVGSAERIGGPRRGSRGCAGRTDVSENR
jgi:hypothetical protein